jgi:micrococcal nuclease
LAGVTTLGRWAGALLALVTVSGCANHAQRGVSGEPIPTALSASIPEDVVCQWARVVRITDGDTVRVDIEGGAKDVAVRYIGMDTPETKEPGKPVQPFGPEASADNEKLVANRRVCMEKDVSESDRYGRLLRVIWREDGLMVNRQLVLDGLAVLETVPPDVKYVEVFREAQADARARQAGMWKP